MPKKPAYLRKEEERLTCPCCGKSVALSGASRTLGRPYFSWGALILTGLRELRTGLISWACDQCLSKQVALKANPEKQLYCDYNPYLAYFTRTRKCRSCKNNFEFTAAEQLHWYETLHFWVQSVPVRCPSCRKKIRHERNLNTELSQLLRDGMKKDKDWLQRVAVIYHVMGKPEKAKPYERLLQKAR